MSHLCSSQSGHKVSSQNNSNKISEALAFIQPYLDQAKMMILRAQSDQKEIKKNGNRTKRCILDHRKKNENKEDADDCAKDQLPIEDSTTFSKKKRKGIECLSLSVYESDLEDYGVTTDDDDLDITMEKYTMPDEIAISKGTVSCSSSSRTNSISGGEKTPEFKDKVKKEKNGAFYGVARVAKNGKKVILLDSGSEDEEIYDRNEDRVVCLNCGKYNQIEKKMRKSTTWVSCIVCKNWYHKSCTDLWRKNPKDIENLEFTCKLCKM